MVATCVDNALTIRSCQWRKNVGCAKIGVIFFDLYIFYRYDKKYHQTVTGIKNKHY